MVPSQGWDWNWDQGGAGVSKAKRGWDDSNNLNFGPEKPRRGEKSLCERGKTQFMSFLPEPEPSRAGDGSWGSFSCPCHGTGRGAAAPGVGSVCLGAPGVFSLPWMDGLGQLGWFWKGEQPPPSLERRAERAVMLWEPWKRL